MTDTTTTPVARSTPAAKPLDDNPYKTAAGAIGVLALLGALLLMLVPGGDDSTSIDLIRVLVGMALGCVGGTLVTCWLLLAGIGWYLQQHQRRTQ